MVRLAVILSLLAAPVLAQPAAQKCSPFAAQKEYLLGQHGESIVWTGIVGTKVANIWMNPESGSWTFTVTDPDGMTCAAAWGQSGQMIAPAVGEGA